MSMFIVRIADTHEFVGIFAAEDRNELASFVDEICSPADCEYMACPNGGIISAAPAAAAVPMRQPTSLELEFGLAELPDFSQAMPGLRPTDGIYEAMHDSQSAWDALDPMCEHPGSQLDALLSSPQGRARAAEIFRSNQHVSLSRPIDG